METEYVNESTKETETEGSTSVQSVWLKERIDSIDETIRDHDIKYKKQLTLTYLRLFAKILQIKGYHNLRKDDLSKD